MNEYVVGLAPSCLSALVAMGRFSAAAFREVRNSAQPQHTKLPPKGAFGAGLTWCATVLEWGVPVHREQEEDRSS